MQEGTCRALLQLQVRLLCCVSALPDRRAQSHSGEHAVRSCGKIGSRVLQPADPIVVRICHGSPIGSKRVGWFATTSSPGGPEGRGHIPSARKGYGRCPGPWAPRSKASRRRWERSWRRATTKFACKSERLSIFRCRCLPLGEFGPKTLSRRCGSVGAKRRASNRRDKQSRLRSCEQSSTARRRRHWLTGARPH
jgi:hypothetical protein